MKIEHIAIWADSLDILIDYYTKYFGANSSDLYVNNKTNFKSKFLSFDSGCRIEVMHRSDIPENKNDTITTQHKGLIHFAFVVDTMKDVDDKAEQLQKAGFPILKGPRKTGDGYYEFETVDPENNRLEVTAKYTEE